MKCVEPEVLQFTGEYRFLSNFASSPFTHEGIDYATNEHFYQSMKTLDPEQRAKVVALKTPGMAKKMGQTVDKRLDWPAVKDDIMMQGLRLKFAIPELRQKLLSTGEMDLYEGNTWGDTYWGVDLKTRHGENKLGKMLMQLRTEIREGDDDAD